MLSPLAGNGTEGNFLPFQLFAGESDIVTAHENVASGTVALQYTVMARRKDGRIIPWAPGVADESGRVFATGTLTFSGQPTAADTVTINSVPITFVAGPTATGNQVVIGASATATAQALQAFLNANTSTFGVSSSGAALVLTLEAETVGAAGNSIGLAKSSSQPAVSAATLTGGSDTPAVVPMEGRAFCIMAQTVDATNADTLGPVYLAGVFNHEVLIWPIGMDTITDRKAAFDGTSISVKGLK